MVAFPYDNLITAVSTLAAALGGVGLKERGDRKERRADAIRQDDQARAERRRAAYAELVTLAGDMQLYLEQMIVLRQTFLADHPDVLARRRQGEEIGKQLGRAISMVQLVGSDRARMAARAVHNATAALSRTVAAREVNHQAADAAARTMFETIDGFLDAVRPETAPDEATAPRQP